MARYHCCFLGGIDVPERCFGVLFVQEFWKGSVYGAFLLPIKNNRSVTH